MSEDRRVKRLFLDSSMVRALLHGQCRINELDVPSNVKIVSVSTEWPIVGIFLLIEHESFEPVPDGAMPPQIYAEWRATEGLSDAIPNDRII